jgi:hypothetical protein
LPTNVVEKIRTCVSGRSRLVSRAPVEWRTVGALLRDLRGTSVVSAKARNTIGPEASRSLLRHFTEVGVADSETGS